MPSLGVPVNNEGSPPVVRISDYHADILDDIATAQDLIESVTDRLQRATLVPSTALGFARIAEDVTRVLRRNVMLAAGLPVCLGCDGGVVRDDPRRRPCPACDGTGAVR